VQGDFALESSQIVQSDALILQNVHEFRYTSPLRFLL